MDTQSPAPTAKGDNAGLQGQLCNLEAGSHSPSFPPQALPAVKPPHRPALLLFLQDKEKGQCPGTRVILGSHHSVLTPGQSNLTPGSAVRRDVLVDWKWTSGIWGSAMDRASQGEAGAIQGQPDHAQHPHCPLSVVGRSFLRRGHGQQQVETGMSVVPIVRGNEGDSRPRTCVFHPDTLAPLPFSGGSSGGCHFDT